MPDSPDEAFLREYDAKQYDHPSVTVDVVLLTVSESGQLLVLLAKRENDPFRDRWALPGGFVRMHESLEEAARRILDEKAGLHKIFLEQLYTFGTIGRDPRTRVITIAYYALISARKMTEATKRRHNVMAAQIEVPWAGEKGGKVLLCDNEERSIDLPFDHAEIIGMAIKRIRGKLRYAPIGFELLPASFTLRDLQRIHEAVLGRELNKDSFRRKFLASDDIEPTGEEQSDVGHRPAALFRFKRRA